MAFCEPNDGYRRENRLDRSQRGETGNVDAGGDADAKAKMRVCALLLVDRYYGRVFSGFFEDFCVAIVGSHRSDLEVLEKEKWFEALGDGK